MGLPLDAAWEKSSEVFLKIAPKTEKDISVLHNGVSPRCSSMAQNRKVRLEENIFFFTWFETIQIALRDLLE